MLYLYDKYLKMFQKFKYDEFYTFVLQLLFKSDIRFYGLFPLAHFIVLLFCMTFTFKMPNTLSKCPNRNCNKSKRNYSL